MDAAHLLVVRHGQSEWNAVGRWQGHADPPLSELGRRQSAVAAESLPRIHSIVSSDLRRASETADIIARRLGRGPVTVDRRLRERDVGEWSGLTRDEIEKGWPGWIGDGKLPDGFEDLTAVVERVAAAVTAIGAANPGRVMLVVTHGGVIRALERAHHVADAPVANLAGLNVRVSPSGVAIGDRLALLEGQTVEVTRNEQL